jgi:hypothetical protein
MGLVGMSETVEGGPPDLVPVAGDETQTLLGSLDRQRVTLCGSAAASTRPACV